MSHDVIWYDKVHLQIDGPLPIQMVFSQSWNVWGYVIPAKEQNSSGPIGVHANGVYFSDVAFLLDSLLSLELGLFISAAMLLVTTYEIFRWKISIGYEMNRNIPGPCQVKHAEGIQIWWRKLMQIVVMLECAFSVIKSVLHLDKNNNQSKHPLSTRLSSGVRGKVIFHYPSAKSLWYANFIQIDM